MPEQQLKAIVEKVRILAPDFALKEKIGNQSMNKIITRQRVTQAERVVEREQQHMEAGLIEDAERLEQLLARISAGAEHKPLLDEMMDIALNIKSGAAMVGYILATEFAKSLYQLCMYLDHVSDNDRAILHAQIHAITYVFSHHNTTFGGPTERELLSHFDHYLQKRKTLPRR